MYTRDLGARVGLDTLLLLACVVELLIAPLPAQINGGEVAIMAALVCSGLFCCLFCSWCDGRHVLQMTAGIHVLLCRRTKSPVLRMWQQACVMLFCVLWCHEYDPHISGGSRQDVNA
jgi:hypothetical protein